LADSLNPLDCDPTDLTCSDPKLFEAAPGTTYFNGSAATISLQAILGHWLRITGDNLYVIDDSRTSPGAVYWNFQNILNDTGFLVTSSSVSEFSRTWNHTGSALTTLATCGTTSDFSNCVAIPPSVTGRDAIATITWTMS